jgi:hypothetical protein
MYEDGMSPTELDVFPWRLSRFQPKLPRLFVVSLPEDMSGRERNLPSPPSAILAARQLNKKNITKYPELFTVEVPV